MSNEWIIDVLADLRAFAVANDLPALSAQLDEAVGVATVELAQAATGARTGTDGAKTGGLLRAAG